MTKSGNVRHRVAFRRNPTPLAISHQSPMSRHAGPFTTHTPRAALLGALCASILAGCIDPELEQLEHAVINGTAVDPQTRLKLGLVDVNGSSGVLLSNDLVLTAGHVVPDGFDRIPMSIWLLGEQRVAVKIVRFHDNKEPAPYEDDPLSGIGPDLALLKLHAPFAIDGSTSGFGNELYLGERDNLIGQGVTIYGRGNATPGQDDRGAWLSGLLTVDSEQPAHQDLLDLISGETQQSTSPGDSGGPTFVDDGSGPRLAGIHSTGYNEGTCGADDSCVGTEVYLARLVWGLTMAMDGEWHSSDRTSVFDVWDAEVRLMREPVLDVNVDHWARQARQANELCTNRGFVGGHHDGHQIEEAKGVTCSGYGASFHDVRDEELLAVGTPLGHIDDAEWSHAARAAHTVCRARGYQSGYPTGFQSSQPLQQRRVYGMVCVADFTFQVTHSELAATGWRVDGVVQTDYAQAMRAAHGLCTSRGHKTGFLTGFQNRNRYGITCQS